MDWGAYGMYLLETITTVVMVIAVLAIVVGMLSNAGQQAGGDKGRVTVDNLSEHWEDLESSMNQAMLSKVQLKQFKKDEKAQRKAEAKIEKAKQKVAVAEKEKQTATSKADSGEGDNANETEDDQKRVFVLDFDGDVHAKECDELRECITAILMIANKSDEVVLRLESPGGVVHGYGLAASQLARIKEANIPLTVCVDKVAASGGYMMACVADTIIAAPFSIIGSIGVLAQLPNFNRLLKRFDVDFEEHTAGQYKRTLTVFGENSDDGRDKFKQELEEVHGLFRDHIVQHRPTLDIDKVSTGEHWYGTQAFEMNLVDKLSTSDEILLAKRKDAKILQVAYERPKSIKEKLGLQVRGLVDQAINSVFKWQSTAHKRSW